MKQILIATLLLGTYGCAKSGGDSAEPSATPPPVVAPTPTPTPAGSWSSTVKNGSEVTTANGWVATIDVADPVQQITLPNGWQVEIVY